VPEAIFSIRKSVPDALVCDMLLGRVGNGYDVIVCLRSLNSKTYAIAVTGLLDPAIEVHARDLGFNAFLRKPYFPSRLVELIES
jgi:CheY-like chemotaxis protein